MHLCSKIKDRETQRPGETNSSDFVIAATICLKEPHPGCEMDFPFYLSSRASFKAISVVLQPQGELWE